MASTATSTVGTEVYPVACTNNITVTVPLVKTLRAKVTWSEQIKSSCFPAYYYSTLISKTLKVLLQLK
jgi:hypothetical protein